MKCNHYDCTDKGTYKLYYEGISDIFFSCKNHLNEIKDFLIRYVIGKTYPDNNIIFSGTKSFKLSSVHGYPLYLTRIGCESNNLFLDELGYIIEMRKHKQLSKNNKFRKDI